MQNFFFKQILPFFTFSSLTFVDIKVKNDCFETNDFYNKSQATIGFATSESNDRICNELPTKSGFATSNKWIYNDYQERITFATDNK